MNSLVEPKLFLEKIQKTVVYRRMTLEDIPAVYEIGYAFYGRHFSDRIETLARALKTFTNGCWVGEFENSEVGR